MMKLQVKIKKVHKDAKIPKVAYKWDAGADVYSVSADNWVYPHSQLVVDTGLQIETPEGYECQVRPKSGLALNHGISIVNTPGTVDSQYRGNLLVILSNLSDVAYFVEKGSKIAQICIREIPEVEFIEANELSETDRGANGFGSTGNK